MINGNGHAGGSSPRLRGTDLIPCNDLLNWRFIPAPAGNGAQSHISKSVVPVHPRACGERLDEICSLRWSDGSSPRLRGTVFNQAKPVQCRRFIPAPAGNGFCQAVEKVQVTVHPRACGERFKRTE